MHMADALVAPAVAGAMYACSAAAAAYSARKVRLEADARRVPVMGVMGAFVFAAQMINFTVPGTGSSGHLCGGMLLAAILGPPAGFLTLIGVLLIQCLLFADGGLLALGCNIWNMAFYGCFVGGFLIWRPMMRRGITKRRIIAASILGCTLTLQMGAFSVSVETLASGITELPFAAFVGVMQPIHLAIGLVEGLITAAVLVFIQEARPELLYCSSEEERENGRLSLGRTLVILGAFAAIIGGALSLAASDNPDGLEWSIARITGGTELEARGEAQQVAGSIQETTSLLPDYGFKGSQSAAGTAFSGLVGAALVIALCVGICQVCRFFGRRKTDGGASPGKEDGKSWDPPVGNVK